MDLICTHPPWMCVPRLMLYYASAVFCSSSPFRFQVGTELFRLFFVQQATLCEYSSVSGRDCRRRAVYSCRRVYLCRRSRRFVFKDLLLNNLPRATNHGAKRIHLLDFFFLLIKTAHVVFIFLLNSNLSRTASQSRGAATARVGMGSGRRIPHRSMGGSETEGRALEEVLLSLRKHDTRGKGVR